jgi:hypothetical protein
MRKLLLFIIASALLMGGLYLVGAELVLAQDIYFRVLAVGALLAALGGYLLWTDFAAPYLGIKTWEDPER